MQGRIRGETKQRFNHSSAGMRWIVDKVNGMPASAHLAAQMAALAIGCHHGGRCDVVSPLDKEPWKDRMYSEDAKKLYVESAENFSRKSFPRARLCVS